MNDMPTYYRVVYFDKKGKFDHLSIETSLEDAIRKRRRWAMRIGVDEDDLNYVNIFKCNANGNNYTHREVCV